MILLPIIIILLLRNIDDQGGVMHNLTFVKKKNTFIDK